MIDWSFGLTVALVGMGGTMLVLWILSIIILLLRKAFPPQFEDKSPTKG
ncbi:MAG: OadG-related small transporter subunit [Candidatus Binatia bacterium]|jgi:Na+-transporting methylmalonyl-CoA/oxaloacetate decarboxylase gamma subunit|nr:OadG-related small transporter subunit [Candidatus Binatia bacterium]